MRARNIKPAFFANEDLAELPFEARLLFIGLWCMADREGRLEDRPKRITMQIFPADAVDADLLLTELARMKLIERYEIDGVPYIEIPTFTKHQSPHYSEKPSIIPPRFQEKPNDDDGGTPGALPEHSEKSAAGRGGRNPLNPDSLNPESRMLNPECSPSERGSGGDANGKAARSETRRPRKRCPEDFEVTDQMRAWATEKFPHVDLERQTETFRDHEFGRAKTDWLATWRNWIRRSAEFGPRNGNGSGRPQQQAKPRLNQMLGDNPWDDDDDEASQQARN